MTIASEAFFKIGFRIELLLSVVKRYLLVFFPGLEFHVKFFMNVYLKQVRAEREV